MEFIHWPLVSWQAKKVSQLTSCACLTDTNSLCTHSNFCFLLANQCCVVQTFVIDKNGKCVMSFNDQMGAEKHVDEALQVVKTLV